MHGIGRGYLVAPLSIMKIISWNCQGFINSQPVLDLYRLVRDKRPFIAFLMETKIKQNLMEKVKMKLGFFNALAINPVGMKGGVTLLYCKDAEVDIINFSNSHIHPKT